MMIKVTSTQQDPEAIVPNHLAVVNYYDWDVGTPLPRLPVPNTDFVLLLETLDRRRADIFYLGSFGQSKIH